jgi:MYXO-CTERM domain-containing protein
MYNANSVVLADINASAAIQLAIWQVEFGEYFQYNTNNDIKNLATTYIGHVTGGIWNPSSGGISLLLPPDGGGGQVLGFATPSAGPDPTPLPSSVILFGSVLGAGYLGLRRRRAKLAGHFAVVVKAAG